MRQIRLNTLERRFSDAFIITYVCGLIETES